MLRSPVTFLPNVPPKVWHYPVKPWFFFFFVKSSAHPSPPSRNGTWWRLLQIMSYKRVVSCVQTLQVNGHSRQRCVSVSGAALHNLQIGSCGRPRLARLLAVNISCVEGESKQRSCILALLALSRLGWALVSCVAPKIYPISTFCCVLFIRCPLPFNLIFCIIYSLYSGHLFP
jgi:hypothetical protein